MSTAAKLGREVAHLYHTNGLAVLFTEECHRAVLLCGLDVGLHSYDLVCNENVSVNECFNCRDLLGCESREVSEVKSAKLLVYVRACLLNVVAEYRAESRLKQVSSRVVTADRVSSCILDVSGDLVAYVKSSVCNGCNVNINAVGLLCVVDLGNKAVGVDGTYVADLTAAFAVEGSAIENDGAVALVYRVNAACIGKDSDNLSRASVVGVAGELGLGKIREERLGGLVPTADVGSCLSCALLLSEHKALEGLLVDIEVALSRDLAGEVDRESKGIVKLEYLFARDNVSILCERTADEVGEDGETCVDSCIEAILFHRNYLEDVISLLVKLGVSALALLDRGGYGLDEEGMVDAEELTVAASAADNSTKNVAASLVGGDNAVGDHKHSASGVVGDNADGDIVVSIVAVGLARDSANVVDYLTDGVNLEHIVNALHYASETLKAHTGVDVLLCKLGVVAVAIVVELREYVVPDLHKSVAIASGLTVGRAATVLESAVEVDLGAGAARTGAMLPEVISLAKTNDVSGVNADLVYPDLVSLLVVLIDRGPEKVLRDLESLGQELPSPRNSLVLEIVAEREVAEHLKEGSVTSGVTYALKVGGTDTFLTGSNSVAGRNFLTGEEFLHRSHT